MKRVMSFSIVMLALCFAAQPACAGRVEADPNKDYLLGKDNGPWMIMVTSFYARQPTAEARGAAYQQAKELVLELRREHGISAYTYRMRTNFGKDVPSARYDPYGHPVKTQVREFYQVAVLAGNFADAEQAQPLLKKIKRLYPQCMRDLVIMAPRSAKGPLWRAFVTTNPFVPDEYLQSSQGPDRLLLQMNSGPFSLYDCPGKYSVVVATFAGASIVEYHQERIQEFLAKLESSDENRLEKAAIEAFELTRALRAKGWEAYVFHDRYSSIVAVGGFNDTKDPRMVKVVEVFRAEGPPDKPQPRKLDRWHFDAQPLPIIVPRRPQ